MATVFDKLNWKSPADTVILNAPASFEPDIATLGGAPVRRSLPRSGSVAFVLAFTTRKAEVDALAPRVATLAAGDAIIWFAYPKGTSKRYSCDFNRDTGWSALGDAGFEPVRQIAIDDDWSALRFRRTSFIRTLRRDPARALSASGRKRAGAR